VAEGALYLMPVWLGEAGGPEQLPPENIAIAQRSTLFFAEHEKTARHMLRRMAPTIDLPSLEMHRMDKDTSHEDVDRYAAMLRTREGVMLSEAGMPAIADPGARLVAAAHRSRIRVVPLAGPSSLLLALAASGMNGQHFTFHGYLPVKPEERRPAIKRLEQEAHRTGAAQLFIETPYRNDAILGDLLRTLQDRTMLCIAMDLMQPEAFIRTLPVKAWRDHVPTLGKHPAVFIIGT
jgi:16S rRNA (cytidine1402-2'-O)-methyltransferase